MKNPMVLGEFERNLFPLLFPLLEIVDMGFEKNYKIPGGFGEMGCV